MSQRHDKMLYIPRVALSSTSSGSSSKSSRNGSNKHRRINGEASSGESESEGIYGSSIHGLRPQAVATGSRNQMYIVHKAPKRGSTQSSTASSSSSSNQSHYVSFIDRLRLVWRAVHFCLLSERQLVAVAERQEFGELQPEGGRSTTAKRSFCRQRTQLKLPNAIQLPHATFAEQHQQQRQS